MRAATYVEDELLGLKQSASPIHAGRKISHQFASTKHSAVFAAGPTSATCDGFLQERTVHIAVDLTPGLKEENLGTVDLQMFASFEM